MKNDKRNRQIINNQGRSNDTSATPRQQQLPQREEVQEKSSWFGRVSSAFQEKLQTSRGDTPPTTNPTKPESTMTRPAEATVTRVQQPPQPAAQSRQPQPAPQPPQKQAPQPTTPSSMPHPTVARRMIIPEGTVIGGSLKSNAETEIAGKIEGDVTIDGVLFLSPTALITGNVKAVSCRVEGLIEGKLECTQDLELAQTGRLNSDVIAGKMVTIAGQLYGSVTTPGIIRLVSNGRIEGNIQTRLLYIEEGATFNGRCTMKAPAQQRKTE